MWTKEYKKEYDKEYSREYRKEHPKWKKESNKKYNKLGLKKKWREKNPIAYYAHNQVYIAVNNGKLKPKPCEICSNFHSEAHHPDYSKPLEVIWLCHSCHMGLPKGRLSMLI